MFYFEILSSLYNNKIKYLIVGGLAVNLHGIPRVTQDLDIIMSLKKNNILKFIDMLEELGYVPRLPIDPHDLLNPKIVRDWIDNRNLKAFTFYNKIDNYKEIDLVLAHPLNFDQAFEKRIKKKVEDIEIYLISLDDLIIMKKKAGRKQDLSDVKLLEKLKQELGE
ncbi:MAG: DUF6036 family nucleotidyltransferase [Promethearchaeota archaeon]